MSHRLCSWGALGARRESRASAVNKLWQMEREAEDVESACSINKNKEVWVCFLLLQTLA